MAKRSFGRLDGAEEICYVSAIRHGCAFETISAGHRILLLYDMALREEAAEDGDDVDDTTPAIAQDDELMGSVVTAAEMWNLLKGKGRRLTKLIANRWQRRMLEPLSFGALAVRDEAVVNQLHSRGEDDMEIALVRVCSTAMLRSTCGDSLSLKVVEFVDDVDVTAP